MLGFFKSKDKEKKEVSEDENFYEFKSNLKLFLYIFKK